MSWKFICSHDDIGDIRAGDYIKLDIDALIEKVPGIVDKIMSMLTESKKAIFEKYRVFKLLEKTTFATLSDPEPPRLLLDKAELKLKSLSESEKEDLEREIRKNFVASIDFCVFELIDEVGLSRFSRPRAITCSSDDIVGILYLSLEDGKKYFIKSRR